MNATLVSNTQKPTALDRQKEETTRLEALVLALRTEHTQMSFHYMRMGWHGGFDNYFNQRKEVHTKLVYAEADLKRSYAREAVLVKDMESQAAA